VRKPHSDKRTDKRTRGLQSDFERESDPLECLCWGDQHVVEEESCG
jgi:hypothetical protein